MEDNKNKNEINTQLDELMSSSFAKYAKYIIQERALPDIRDGLKPVQRRILFAMHQLKILADKPYKKSARTVGEVIGKYHPHGDSSIYEAMVRMSQEWKNNFPLIDMQGNKGSIDGDNPAAMRYTEARLSSYGQFLLNDIEKNTVQFVNNFDDQETEPTILPSFIPNILINGASGIAAGYAANIPPFNFKEVIEGIIYKIKHPNADLSDIKKIILAPDFPTGGELLELEGVDTFFETGKGKFAIRAKLVSESSKLSKKAKSLIIKEIPFEVNKSKLMEQLEEIRINNELNGLLEVRDDSDKEGISIALEFSLDVDLNSAKAFLYKKTQLQISYSANAVLIKDKKPIQAGLITILVSFIEHINDLVVKKANFVLENALKRKEILEGLIKAVSNIDLLIKTIKEAESKENAIQNIMKNFDVNENQADAIVNLRLYALTNFDINKLKQEFEKLLETIAYNQRLIQDQSFRDKYLIEQLNEQLKTFKSERRTQLVFDQTENNFDVFSLVANKTGNCLVTKEGYLKYIETNSDPERDFELNKYKIKSDDLPIAFFELNTKNHLVLVSNFGKIISIPAFKIDFSRPKDIGIHLANLLTLNEQENIVYAFKIDHKQEFDQNLILASQNGFIKQLNLNEINLAKTIKSTTGFSLKGDDVIVSAFLKTKKDDYLVSISKNGRAIKYLIDEIPVVGKTASGVKNMLLKDKDYVACCIPSSGQETFLTLITNRGGKRIHDSELSQTSRAKIGITLFNQVETNPIIVINAFLTDSKKDLLVLLDSQKLIEFKIGNIPIMDVDSKVSNFAQSNILDATFLDYEANQVEYLEASNLTQPKVNKQTGTEYYYDEKSDSIEKVTNYVEKDELKTTVEKYKNKAIKSATNSEQKKEDITADQSSLTTLEMIQKEIAAINKDFYDNFTPSSIKKAENPLKEEKQEVKIETQLKASSTQDVIDNEDINIFDEEPSASQEVHVSEEKDNDEEVLKASDNSSQVEHVSEQETNDEEVLETSSDGIQEEESIDEEQMVEASDEDSQVEHVTEQETNDEEVLETSSDEIEEASDNSSQEVHVDQEEIDNEKVLETSNNEIEEESIDEEQMLEASDEDSQEENVIEQETNDEEVLKTPNNQIQEEAIEEDVTLQEQISLLDDEQNEEEELDLVQEMEKEEAEEKELASIFDDEEVDQADALANLEEANIQEEKEEDNFQEKVFNDLKRKLPSKKIFVNKNLMHKKTQNNYQPIRKVQIKDIDEEIVLDTNDLEE